MRSTKEGKKKEDPTKEIQERQEVPEY